MTIEKKCVICGKAFHPRGGMQKCCSPECSAENRKICSRIYHAAHRADDARRKKERQLRIKLAEKAAKRTFDETVAAADAAGLSYGQYVIRERLKNESYYRS